MEQALRELASGSNRGRSQRVRDQTAGKPHKIAVTSLRSTGFEEPGELALQRAPDLVAIRPEPPKNGLDFTGQHRFRHFRATAEDGPACPAQHSFGTTEQHECCGRGYAPDPHGIVAESRRDVGGGSTGCFELDDLGLQPVASG